MDIQEFLDLWSGKWFSQRTVHDLRSQQNQNHKADLWIENIEQDAASIVQLCATFNQDPAQIRNGFQIRWTETGDLSSSRKPAKEGSTILVFCQDLQSPLSGTLLRQDLDGTTSTGQYHFGEDEVLTMMMQVNEYQFSERFWFASPNLRMRNTLIRKGDETQVATFCTEIRMVAKPATPPSDQAVAQTNAT